MASSYEEYMAMTAPDLGYDTDILFMIPSPYYLPDLGIKWLNQNILASREVFHALCAYKFLLGVKRRFFRCVEESVKVEEDKANTQDGTEGMNGLWHRVHYGMEDDKCELGARGLESVIALIIAEARRYQIDLNLSTFSEPMTFQRAIAVLRVHFEEVLRPTKVGRYSRLFPGLGGEDLIRHSTWESDGLKIFGPNPEHWWRNVLLPGDGVGGCWIERETDVKGKRLSGGQF